MNLEDDFEAFLHIVHVAFRYQSEEARGCELVELLTYVIKKNVSEV
jgi:hypothetical protein